MHYFVAILALILAPALASAHGSVQSSVSATSNSGGNVVGPGGKVETGNSSASANVSSSVSGSSSSSVYIKTNANGTVHEETYSSQSGQIDVSVQATPKETKVEVREGGQVIKQETVPAAAEAAANASSSASTTVAAEAGTAAPQGILQKIFALLGSLFSWF